MIYLIKNLKSFAVNNTSMFALFLFCQITVVIVLLFSYGTIQNFELVKKENGKPFSFEVTFGEDAEWHYDKEYREIYNISESLEPVDNKSVKEFLNAIDEKTLSKISELFYFAEDVDAYIIEGNEVSNELIKEASVGFWLTYSKKDKQFHPYDVAFGNTPAIGKVISEEDFVKGRNQALLPEGYIESETGKTVVINGIEYEITGIQLNDDSILIPYIGSPNDLDGIYSIHLDFSSAISDDDYESIKNAAVSVYGGKALLPDIETISSDLPFYDSIIAVAFFLALIAAVTLMILYRYILEKRKRTIAIFRLNGCTKQKITAMLILEVVVITVICTAVSTALYFGCITEHLKGIFTYITQVYNAKNVARLLLIELVSVAVVNAVMIGVQLNKAPIENTGKVE